MITGETRRNRVTTSPKIGRAGSGPEGIQGDAGPVTRCIRCHNLTIGWWIERPVASLTAPHERTRSGPYCLDCWNITRGVLPGSTPC